MIYATFGFGSAFSNCYVEIETDDPSEAREAMNSSFGPKWGFLYEEEKFAGQPEKYSLKRLARFVKNEHGDFKAVELMGEADA